MDKGLLIIIAIGIAFIYFAINVFNVSSSDDDTQGSSSGDKTPYAQYYEKDALGDDVLNLSSLSLDRAKVIWATTPTGKNIAGTLPNFDLAKIKAENAIVEGAFRRFVMQHLEKVKGRYLAGEINGDQAQQALLGLR
jgi:hypothetical protein